MSKDHLFIPNKLVNDLRKAGLVIMPIEASYSMTMAGCDSLPSCEHVFGHAGKILRDAYEKMVVVAALRPSPQANAEASDD